MSKKDRLFKRPGRRQWHADLRDLGAGRPSTGCVDRDEAVKWLARKLIGLEAPSATGPGRMPIEAYSEHHLEAKRLNRRESTVERDERSIRYFLNWAGSSVTLEDIDPQMLNTYARERQVAGIAAQSVLHELHALSSLFKRAVAEGYVLTNPVALMVDKPRIERPEPDWLEPEEGARLIDACVGDVQALVAIALLTGGRKAEVLGLETADVDFKRGIVRIRPNKWRALKTERSKRTVRLWPQLREILEARDLRPGPLVPNSRGEPYTDVRGGMEGAIERAKIEKRVSWTTFRHTYASLRLQTVDNGHSVSVFNVARELGHSGATQIFKTYGHVIDSPQRLEVVEYRLPEQKGGNSE